MSNVVEAILAGIVLFILGATAVCVVCTAGVAQIGKQEEKEAQQVIEDDRFSCGLIEED